MEQKFTQMAQEALSDAVQNAAALGNPQVDTLHLLDAMLRQENSMARALGAIASRKRNATEGRRVRHR